MIAPAAFPGQGPVSLPVFPRDDAGRYWYAVARVRTGELLYCGRDLWRAACSLVEGTCYAVAEEETQASALAVQSARWFRDRQAARQEQTPDGSGQTPKGSAKGSAA